MRSSAAVKDEHSPWMVLAEKMMASAKTLRAIGAHPVDVFPICKSLDSPLIYISNFLLVYSGEASSSVIWETVRC